MSMEIVRDTFVLASVKDKHYTHVKVMLPTRGFVTKSLRRAPVFAEQEKYERAYVLTKAAKEILRDTWFAIFGDDWRWYEASIPTREQVKMLSYVAAKLGEVA